MSGVNEGGGELERMILHKMVIRFPTNAEVFLQKAKMPLFKRGCIAHLVSEP